MHRLLLDTDVDSQQSEGRGYGKGEFFGTTWGDGWSHGEGMERDITSWHGYGYGDGDVYGGLRSFFDYPHDGNGQGRGW